MKIAVTGAAGFIGRRVAALAHDNGHDVAEIDRAHGVDILDPDALGGIVPGCDAVVHLAGMLGTSELYGMADRAVDVNVKGTLRVLEACRDTGAAYVGITMPDCWTNLYQATKLAAQRVALGFHRDYGVPVTHIRAFNVYGPGQAYGPGHPQKILPTFASRSWRREPMPIWGDGEQKVDMVHVDDVAGRLLDAAEGGDRVGHGEVWDAGTGRPVSVIGVARRVAAITGCGIVEFLPMRPGETPGTAVCAADFGPWDPAPFDLDDDNGRWRHAVEAYQP